jgi:uncharacterized protein YydD (DUF2326 family)
MTYYRCHVLRECGDWLAVADIESDSDDDAITQARQLSDGHAFELRVQDRLIHRQETAATGAMVAEDTKRVGELVN